jgi:hypothetical protein
MGVATSSVTFFRQMGGALGTAVFLSILFSAAPSKIAERFRAAGVRPPTGSVDLNDTSNLKRLPSAVQEPILAGFSDAISVVFLVGACVLVIAFVLSLMMKEVPPADVGHRPGSRGRGGRDRGGRTGKWAGGSGAGRRSRVGQWPALGPLPSDNGSARVAPLVARSTKVRSELDPESAEPLDRGSPQ